jgi:LmbE family N-acetylglucosaminyl deacetylase
MADGREEWLVHEGRRRKRTNTRWTRLSTKRLLDDIVYDMTKEQNNPLPRRDAILAAAASRFRRQGFERTSVREIAQAMGMTSGSLFYHFATKEELLVTIMEGACATSCSRCATGWLARPGCPSGCCRWCAAT